MPIRTASSRISASAPVVMFLTSLVTLPAQRPHVEDGLAHLLQVGPRALEQLGRPADHEVQVAGADDGGYAPPCRRRSRGRLWRPRLGHLARGAWQDRAVDRSTSVPGPPSSTPSRPSVASSTSCSVCTTTSTIVQARHGGRRVRDAGVELAGTVAGLGRNVVGQRRSAAQAQAVQELARPWRRRRPCRSFPPLLASRWANRAGRERHARSGRDLRAASCAVNGAADSRVGGVVGRWLGDGGTAWPPGARRTAGGKAIKAAQG